jgi:hydrogenase maturation protease
MNLDAVEKIAEAVLYEGYMLYPYRRSSIKNRRRWNFGVLYPKPTNEDQLSLEPSAMQTECMVEATTSTRLEVKIRFLQIVERTIGRVSASTPLEAESTGFEFEPVDRLEVNGTVYLPWEEAIEREVEYSVPGPTSLSSSALSRFVIPAGRSVAYLRNEHGTVVGETVRQWERLEGEVDLRTEQCRDGVVKLTVRIGNLASEGPSHSVGLLRRLVSTHTILGVEDGRFLSLLEPPPGLEDLAAQCENISTWPVLAGRNGESMLSSPIILYDYPQIAPESAGNLFDSTEIDEILSLRILTLAEDEKREMRESDARSREILERTEAMPEEQFMKLHGALRGLTPIAAGPRGEETR